MGSRLALVAILVALGGCVGEEEVASQVSAVEAPAPDPTDDMMRIRDYCLFSCGDAWQQAGDACRDAHPFAPHVSCGEPYCRRDDSEWSQCNTSASQANDACAQMCQDVFGGSTNGGSHLPGNAP